MDYQNFDSEISKDKLRTVDRAVSILWLAKTIHGIDGMNAKEIALIMERDCGHPKQNDSRLREMLRSDPRTVKHGRDGFRLKPDSFRKLGEKYGGILAAPSEPTLRSSHSIVPREVFEPTSRNYLIRLIDQVNGCYQNGYFDGVMVLGRKLVETLMIEVYAQRGFAADVKRADGSFYGFEELAGKLSADTRFNITRETKKTLAEIKRFGDQSAHNQRFTARLSDVDGIKTGLRIAAEELLHHCNYLQAVDAQSGG